MSETSTNGLSLSAQVKADAVSRRAYELWEKEGRPEGSDLRHWLQAEQELAGGLNSVPRTEDETARASASDARPLQGTRAASAANRETRRGTPAPLNGDKNNGGNAAAKRKPSNAPVM